VVSDTDHISNNDEIESPYYPISVFQNDQLVNQDFGPDSDNHIQENYSEYIQHSIQNIYNLDSNINQTH